MGDAQRQALFPNIATSAAPKDNPAPGPTILEVDHHRTRITIDDRVTFQKNTTAALLIELADLWLTGAGQGLPPLDYPLLRSAQLAQRLGLESEEAVRRQVNRARTYLGQRFESRGMDGNLGSELIETIPWQGYRLAPDRVTVQKTKQN